MTDRRRVPVDKRTDTDRLLAELVTRVDALEQRMEQLQAAKLDTAKLGTAVGDAIGELLRSHRR